MIYTIINIFQIAGVLMGFLTLLFIARKKASETQKVLLIACGCAFVSVLAYTLEINAKSLEAMIMAIKFGYVGKCYIMLFFLMFMAYYCNINIPQIVFRIFLIFNSIMLMIIITCDRHSLYYKSIRLCNEGLFPHAELEKGVCYWMMMTVMLGLMSWYIILCLMEVRKRKGIEKKRLLLLSFSGLIPGYMLTIYLTGIMDVLDPVPLGIVLSCMLLTLNVTKYGLLDTMELAREKIIENTKDGLVILDANYNLLYANDVARALFPDINSSESREEQIGGIFKENAREAIVNIEGRNYEIRVSRIEDNNHSETVRGYMAWIFDMTFVNHYTEEMIRMRQEAEKANLAKTSFLAHMSHEIRTPMNAIIGFSDLCLNNGDEGEMREYIQSIRESAGALMVLINEVLDISKIESGKIALTDVAYSMRELMKEVISAIVPQINAKNLTFRYLLEKDIPVMLKGDKKEVRHIMSNLLSNAIKYTSEGTILFKVKEIQRKDRKILLEIIVKDTGIGIKEEDREQIFDRFERFDEKKNYAVEGTGLGLSIVKDLVKLMDGSVEVESSYGEGSLFRARIWQEILDERQGEVYRGSNCDDIRYTLEQLKNAVYGNKGKRKRRSIRFPGAKVLVVDDNQVNLKVASGLLKLYDIDAELVESGEECLEAVKKQNYDLIFMDQMMPEMDGVETLSRFRESKRGNNKTPVIALTANALVGVREEMLEEGFDDFLGKPMDLTELENILIRFLKDQQEEMPETENEDTGIAPETVEKYEGLIQQGIDVQAGIELCGGEESYQEVLKAFVKNAPVQQRDFSMALKQGDYERYTVLAHALKSASASIGALKLSEIARMHEGAGSKENILYINEDFVNLIEEYEDVIKAIETGFLKAE
ncbi:MAG: response regulator [Lachnospiraceae bacterium]|nr:response regulator [Lachnospiraceae bacterium]